MHKNRNILSMGFSFTTSFFVCIWLYIVLSYQDRAMGDFFACFNRYDDMTQLNKKALIDKNQRFDIGLDTNRLTHTHTHFSDKEQD